MISPLSCQGRSAYALWLVSFATSSRTYFLPFSLKRSLCTRISSRFILLLTQEYLVFSFNYCALQHCNYLPSHSHNSQSSRAFNTHLHKQYQWFQILFSYPPPPTHTHTFSSLNRRYIPFVRARVVCVCVCVLFTIVETRKGHRIVFHHNVYEAATLAAISPQNLAFLPYRVSGDGGMGGGGEGGINYHSFLQRSFCHSLM